MDLNVLLLKYGDRLFEADGDDESGSFMLVDDYKIHIRRDDVNLVVGLPINEVLPLIDTYTKSS